MKKMVFKSSVLIFIISVIGLTVGCSKSEQKVKETDVKEIKSKTKKAKTPKAEIVCNQFNLVTNITNSTLNLSINTDLPDSTIVMVGVSRSYLEKGNSSTYSIDYFSEKSTIGKWKSNHEISITSKLWKSKLRAKQEEMSRFDLGFDVASINNNISVSMVVPINQSDSRFGKQNINLTGKKVSTEYGIKVVKDEITINYPLDSPPSGESPFPNLNPSKLENGHIYIISKQTPLMPSFNPTDSLAAIQQIKQIPKGGFFEVLEIRNKRNTPWYKVIAFNQSKNKIGTGWINSTALIGQELKAYK